jgi:SAM-dependent methyltransferase
MRKRLDNISQADFDCFLEFARRHPSIVTRDHMLQKLTIFNFVAPLVARCKPQDLLEIGCGLGFHSALLTRFGRVSATELEVPGSFVAISSEIARDRAVVLRELAAGEVDFRVNDGRSLPFSDASFDLLFHNSVIEHVPDVVAFNRETARLLRPGGVVICITGTPALCRFRFIRNYLLRLPLIIAAALVRESGLTSRRSVTERMQALLPSGVPGVAEVQGIASWYARLAHYLASPAYNSLVLDGLASEAGLSREATLATAHRQLRDSLVNRLRFYLTPQTHGQHYRDYRQEMDEWRLDRWRSAFTRAGLQVLELIPYRFHHLLEATWSPRLNAALYHLAAPLIERYQRTIPPRFASEFVLLARRP